MSRHNYEVSGFGDDGEGDGGDNWKLECLQRKGSENAEQMWESDSLVRFMHVDTNRWLSSSTKVKFNGSNCPNCPIHGELEVSGTNHNSDADLQNFIFRADDGVYLHV